MEYSQSGGKIMNGICFVCNIIMGLWYFAVLCINITSYSIVCLQYK